jgi:hypothetical protein
MLAPAPASVADDTMVVHHAQEVTEIVVASQTFSITHYKTDLCGMLAQGAETSLSIANRLEEVAMKESDDTELRSSTLSARDRHLRLFAVCFEVVCSIDPEMVQLRSIAHRAIEPVLLAAGSDSAHSQFNGNVAFIVCQLISKRKGMDSLVISIFPLLCKLVSSPNAALREAACNILSEFRIAESLTSAQIRCEDAERRAALAETKLKEVEHFLELLKKENGRLKKDVAVLEASAVH